MPTITSVASPKQIETEATRTSIADIAAFLQAHLGQRPTAYLSGLKDAKTVGQWGAGKVIPRDPAALRLRHAYQAVRLLAEAFGDETAKAWLFGINSQLDGEAPAFVLRHATLPEEVSPVIRAARSFAEGGHGSRTWSEAAGLRKAQSRGSLHFARALVSIVEGYLSQPSEVAEPLQTSRFTRDLLRARGSLGESVETLELARSEVMERLDEVVQYLKDDLARTSEEAFR